MLSVYLALALILALFVISSPVISAVISLIVTIVLASFILFELNLNYVAIVYLLVYVGAILILLIFVVLAVPLENNNWTPTLSSSGLKAIPIGFLLAGCIIVFNSTLLVAVWEDVSNINSIHSFLDLPTSVTVEQSLAQEFYSSNTLALIIVSLLLFIAIVGSIGLSF